MEEEVLDIDDSIDSSGDDIDSGQDVVASFESDPRFSSEWGSDVNNAYRHFSEIEKKYQGYESEVEKYKAQLGEWDQKYKALETKMGEYTDIQNLIGYLEQNPTHQKTILESLEKVIQEENRARYGDVPPEVMERLMKADELQKRFDMMEQEKENERQIGIVRSQLSEIDSIAEKYGVEYDKTEFLSFCKQKNISPDRMLSEFSRVALPHVAGKMSERASAMTAKKISENKSKAIAPGQNKIRPASKSMGLRDTVLSMVGRN